MRGIIRLRLIVNLGLALLFVGCTSAPANKPSSARDASTVPERTEVATPVEKEEQEAQRIWCEYLNALHSRADSSSATLPSFQKCLKARTFAAPKMLRETAQCSRRALDDFPGDPLTREYAAAVARCGSTALDACEVRQNELAPFVLTICSQVDHCGNTSYAECAQMLDGRMRVHLSRAIGALNGRGRDAFQTCLQKITCGDIGPQIIQCLEPIMDGLLWLPE